MNWKPRLTELKIPFDTKEYELYKQEKPASRYTDVGWLLRRGRSKHGEFPVIVVREYFRELGFSVWVAEPEMPDNSGFILVSYPGKRRANHPAFERMISVFGKDIVTLLNQKADEEKKALTGNTGGRRSGSFCFQ